MTKPSREKRIAINDKYRKSLVTRGRTYIIAGINAPLQRWHFSFWQFETPCHS
jgi:hypothetical protein